MNGWLIALGLLILLIAAYKVWQWRASVLFIKEVEDLGLADYHREIMKNQHQEDFSRRYLLFKSMRSLAVSCVVWDISNRIL